MHLHATWKLMEIKIIMKKDPVDMLDVFLTKFSHNYITTFVFKNGKL